jgi:hypothetical protein
MNKDSKTFKIISLIGGFIMRTIALPFWAVITLLGFGYQWICTCVQFWLWGGEVVAYSLKNRRKMMNDVYAYAKLKMDEQKVIDKSYQPLFNYFADVHGLTLLESEMQDIIAHAKSL